MCLYIVATLSQLKFTCLEGERKEAKQKYQDHLQAYVTMQLGRPLEKLNVGHSLIQNFDFHHFCLRYCN